MEEKQKDKLIKKLLKNKKIAIIFAVIVVVLLFVLYITIFVYNHEPEITSEQISAMLSKESKLTTATLNGKGFSTYTDEGLKVINRSDFLMTYDYEVNAGVDVSKIKPNVNEREKVVYLNIPKAEIFYVKVDPSSIHYYDTKFSLFNVDEKEDANKAHAEAEKDARETAEETGILNMANEQAEALITGIVTKSIPKGYQVRVKK